MNSISAPSLFVPLKDKDEKWHKQFVQAITSRSITGGYNDRYTLANECVNFYLGLQSGEEFAFMQKAEDGEVLPAKWMDYNKIAVKVDLIVGELSQRGYKINVKAYNKDAQSRKMQEKDRLLMEMRFAPIADYLEETVGLPIQSDSGFVPNSNEELDIYMGKTYKEKSEIVMGAILNWLKRTQNWDYLRIALFRDLLIMGSCFVKNEIVDGMPVMTRVDPRYIIFDVNAKDDFLSDATYWGEICYMSLQEVTKRYKISEKELKEAYQNYSNYLSNQPQYAQFAQDFGFIDNRSKVSIFKNVDGDVRVLVVKAYWQDYKVLSHKMSKDKFGNTHVKKEKTESVGEDIKNNVVQIWRKGTLIAGKFMKDFGEMENQTRSVDPDRMSTTEPPYTALIPNFMNGTIVSKVNRLRPLQNLKNIAMYKLQVAMSQAGAKGFMYDISQLPKGWDLHTAMKYIRVAGLGIIDSSVDNAGQYNQFKEFDQSIPESVNRYIEISMLMDREMDAISGINEARQGLVKSASQAVGVTNSALIQSNLSTAMYFDMFSNFFSKNLQKQAGLAKIAWAGKEKFAPIIGDTGVDFLKTDIDLDLDDYNVFVDDTPAVLADQQIFFQLVMTALQSQSISFSSALKLFMEKDIDEGVRILDAELAKAEMMAEQQQEMAAQQADQEMAMKQQELAQKQAAEQASQQAQSEGKQIESQADLAKVIAQGRLDLRQQLLGFKQDMALKRMDMAIAKQKASSKQKGAEKKKK